MSDLYSSSNWISKSIVCKAVQLWDISTDMIYGAIYGIYCTTNGFYSSDDGLYISNEGLYTVPPVTVFIPLLMQSIVLMMGSTAPVGGCSTADVINLRWWVLEP